MSAIRFDDVRRWVFEHALPFWSTVGSDRPGLGFVEHLNLNGRPADVPYKRTRVQARQIYVFSHAALLGAEGALETARNGYAFLTENGRLPDGTWARRLGREGGVLDAAADLYDHAFVLFALAWWARASGDDEALRLADETLPALDRVLGREDGRGYHAEAPFPAEAVQNPHMHLLEALSALYETSGEERYRRRASRIAELFRTTFFDAATGTLAEYYAPDWTRAPGVRGRMVEPGHQFEWSWLLHHAGRLTGVSFASEARGLFRFAEENGLQAGTGLTWDEVLDDGSVHKRSFRCWPQTETLKAHLARFEFEGELDAGRVAQIVDNVLDRYLAVEPRGVWTEHLDEDGRPYGDKIPTSTLYHVFLAFAELLRLQPDIERRLGAR